MTNKATVVDEEAFLSDYRHHVSWDAMASKHHTRRAALVAILAERHEPERAPMQKRDAAHYWIELRDGREVKIRM